MVWMMTMCNVSLLEQRLSVSWTRILFIVIVTLTYWMDYCMHACMIGALKNTRA